MRLGIVFFTAGLLLLTIGMNARAQDRPSYTGIAWGFTRTFWSGEVNDEGYAHAGTAGPTLSLRRVRQISDRWTFAPYFQYFWMRSTVSTLACDTCYSQPLRTERSYFRELDLGLNLQFFPAKSNRNLYLGGGPSVRWGQAGQRERGGARPGDVAKAAWFGLSAVAGWQRTWGNRAVVFFEPQLTLSPDEADRWQKAYPPDNIVVQMGILWR